MSHGQPKSPQAEETPHQEPVEYGDVSKVPVESASKPISPLDAAAMAASGTTNNQGITETVGGQVQGQRVKHHAPTVPTFMGSAAIDGDPITIGEALEAVAISAGDKPVDQSHAAAISAAEIRATGETNVRPGGVGANAQSAATLNSQLVRREEMTSLSDVLTDAAAKLAVDKAVTKEDAEAVYAAEVQFPWRSDAPEVVADPGGVAASMATAAKLNEG